jgi:MYXO-CTERM domain-containing protein
MRPRGGSRGRQSVERWLNVIGDAEFCSFLEKFGTGLWRDLHASGLLNALRGRCVVSLKITLFVLAISVAAALAPNARADVVYTVLNPAKDFTLLIYDSPTFITTDTTVSVAQLAFANPANTITSVDFIPSSSTFAGTSELDVVQSGAPEQFRYYPEGTFTRFGVTPGDSNSFGYPNSELSVAMPEPASISVLGMALIGLAGLLSLRRRLKSGSQD